MTRSQKVFRPNISRCIHCSVVSFVSLLVLIPLSVAAQPVGEINPTVNRPMEEMVVEGSLPDVSEMGRFELINYYNANANGGLLYKMRRYDEAKPYLEIGAQLGFKMSQARLGAIYLYGLGTTEQDVEKGMVWLGVAAEPRTDPQITKTYRELARKLPDEMRGYLESKVAEASSEYGAKASGTKCRMIRQVGTHMSELNCEVRDMYKFRSAADANDLCLMQGIGNIQSEGGGEMGIAAISVTPCI